MDIFDKVFSEFQFSALRIETLFDYHIEGGEWEEYEQYNKGLPIRGFANQEWIDQLEKWKKRKRAISRIRIVPDILNRYLRYELEWCFPKNWIAGEDIIIVNQHEYEKHIAPKTKGDYWIFDDKLILKMQYDKKGRFTGGELINGKNQINNIRELSIKLRNESIPYTNYMGLLREAKLFVTIKK